VLFFFGAGVSRAQAGLPGFLGLAERVLKELRALPDSPAGKLVDLAARLQEERIEGVGGILAADRIFGLLERDFAIADIEHAVGRALRPQPGANLDAHRTLVEAAGRRRCRNARRLRPRAFASRVCERPRDLDVLAEEVRPKKKPRTIELYTHYLCKLVGPRLASRKALEVTPAAVDNLHRRLGAKTPVSANRVIVALSGVYTFAARRRLIADGVNPARGVEKFREQGRERYLSTDELARLGQVLRAGEIDGLAWPREKGRAASKHDRKPDKRKTLLSKHVIAAFRLLLFTGCRLREILRLRWSEVDLERGLLLLPDSKTGRKTVVLNAPARQVLADMREISAGEYVILGDDPKKPRADLQKPWDLVKHHAKLEGVRLHDLRHTHASVGAGAGLGLQIIGKLLGHKHADTTARYAHLADDPLRRASDRIGSEIAAALGDHAVADEVRKLR